METSVVLPYLLISVSIISGIAGIALIIAGLIKSKTKIWIIGIVLILTATVIGFFNYDNSISLLQDKSSENTDSTITTKKHNAYVFSDSTTYSERPVDSTFAEPISGMVEDKDFKKVYIKVFPSRELKACGLTLDDVEKGRHKKDVIQAIAAVFSLEKEFSGKLTLIAYDYEKKVLGKSNEQIKGIMGDRKTINFSFSESTDFSLIDYCTLGFGE